MIKKKDKRETWSPDQIRLLKKHFPATVNEEVARLVGKTVRAVRSKAQVLKIKKSTRFWDKKDEDYLLKNWDVMSAEELGKKLGKTKWGVINKFRELKGLR